MVFQKRLAGVLVFLTLTVGVVAYRIAVDSGLRRVEAAAREGLRLLAAAEKERAASAVDPGEAERRVEALTGVRVRLPRDESLFAFRAVWRARVGRVQAAGVFFLYEGRPCLLLVMGRGILGGTAGESAFFADSGFISGEREGKAFVFWRKEGAAFLLAAAGDLPGAFDLVRRHLT